MFEIADSPQDLGAPVALVGQRQNHVIVGLGQRRAVAAEALAAFGIRRQDGGIGLGLLLLQPGEQRRAEVKADARVIVGNQPDGAFAIQNARRGVGGVAFGGDALVPVVVGRG